MTYWHQGPAIITQAVEGHETEENGNDGGEENVNRQDHLQVTPMRIDGSLKGPVAANETGKRDQQEDA